MVLSLTIGARKICRSSRVILSETCNAGSRLYVIGKARHKGGTEKMNTSMDVGNLIKPEEHRQLAATFFNETWRLLNLTDRSDEQDAQMIHCAHASRMHWELVGNSKNQAIGEWQIARVYSILRFPQSALYHATVCMAIVEQAGMKGFLMGCAHEGMARALALTDKQTAAIHHKKALEVLSSIDDPEDAKILRSDLTSIELGD